MFQFSRAEALVNTVTNVGISVLHEIVQNVVTGATQSQSVSMEGCSGVTFEDIDMSQIRTLDLNVLASQLSDQKVATDILDKMVASATAESKGGIGIQDADSKTVIDTAINIKESLVASVKSFTSDIVVQSQSITCKDSAGGMFRRINMSQFSSSVLRIVAQNKAVSDAYAKAVADVTAVAAAKATGWDPTALLLLIAAGAAVVLLGGGGGILVAKKVVSSVYLWITLSGVATAFSSYFVVAPFTETWPAKKIDPILDSDTVIKEKKSRNKNVLIGGSISTGIFGLATAGLVIYKLKKK